LLSGEVKGKRASGSKNGGTERVEAKQKQDRAGGKEKKNKFKPLKDPTKSTKRHDNSGKSERRKKSIGRCRGPR